MLRPNRYTVQKENANKGRQFFACSKPLGEPTKCTFFLWADNNAPQNNIFQDTNYDRQHSNYNRNFHNSNQNRDHSIPNFRAKKRGMPYITKKKKIKISEVFYLIINYELKNICYSCFDNY